MEKLRLRVIVDRPIGYVDKYNNVYPLNYGYIQGVIGGDGEEQDAYILINSDEQLEEYIGNLIAIVHRRDDIETKWIVSNEAEYNEEWILSKINFMEKHFDSYIELL